jgi:hypothetical protein
MVLDRISKLNLRGRYCATVPANECLAKLLALLKDRRLVSVLSALRATPSAGGPASPLDFYLSWMSPVYPRFIEFSAGPILCKPTAVIEWLPWNVGRLAIE